MSDQRTAYLMAIAALELAMKDELDAAARVMASAAIVAGFHRLLTLRPDQKDLRQAFATLASALQNERTNGSEEP